MTENVTETIFFDTERPHLTSTSHDLHPSAHLCDLCAPVEQDLGADVLPVFAHVVQETAERHELRDEHHLGGETHR